MEIKKIAFACFIGGSICSAIALVFAPLFWWLGLIAGFAGGYISYEFREFTRAIPVAFKSAWRISVGVQHSLISSAQEWASRPHPFLLLAILVGLPVGVLVLGPSQQVNLQGMSDTFFYVSLYFIYICMFVQIAFPAVVLLAFIGARVGERCYWYPFVPPMDKKTEEETVARLERVGYKRMPATYGSVIRWTIKGIGLTFIFFGWTIWRYLAIGIWKLLGFLVQFGWYLFKLIHSRKRVLCAIDGTLGGAITFLWLAPYAATLDEQAILVVFGGLIGAAFGIANWEIVSKRFLHVDKVH